MKTTASVIAFTALLSASITANAGDYQGWWWSAATDGMGLNIEQQGDTLGVAWYHFDEDRSPSYVLLAGKLVDDVLSGELQAASGPPPGPGYNPADVVRNTIGTATLTFKPSEPGSDQTTATLEYTMNGRSGSLVLARFATQPAPPAGPWSVSYSTAGSAPNRIGGSAFMKNTGGNHYRLAIGYQSLGGTDFFPRHVFDLDLSGSGSIFTGSGRFSDTIDLTEGAAEGTVEVKRLQVENGVLIFDYVSTVTKEWGVDQVSPRSVHEILVGFPPLRAGVPPYGFPPLNAGASSGFPPAPYSGFYQSGWWWDPSKDGMGLNVEQQGDTIAVAWYHFDEDHSPSYALLTGTIAEDPQTARYVLTGPLQKASGPPPGPGYDPANVSRETAGTATLSFTSATSATFEYTLNGHSGSLDLSRFTGERIPLSTGSWKYASGYMKRECADANPLVVELWPGGAIGTATLEKTGNNQYRLKAQPSFLFASCTYDLVLIQSGSIFTGSGHGTCLNDTGRIVAIRSITAKRLQTKNGMLIFDYALSNHGREDALCKEDGSLIGMLRTGTNP